MSEPAAPSIIDRRLAALVRVSAALSCADAGGSREAIEEAVRLAPAPELEEAILQAYLFVGFPTVLEAFAVLRELGVETPESHPDPDDRERRARGRALCRRVYGRSYDRLRARIAELHPDLDRWMIEEGYGKTLSRPGLAAAERELCAVGLLAAGGHVPQLLSHLRGALHTGAPADLVGEALEIGIEQAHRWGAPGANVASSLRDVWAGVRDRAEVR